MNQPPETTTMDAPPWTDGLADFYSFLADAQAGWKGTLDDVNFPASESVEKLLDVISPRVPLFDPDALRLPLFVLNALRKLEEKPPLQFDKGIGRLRERKFVSALVEDLESPSELARTVRLVAVFSRYPPDRLRAYAELIDSELSAFESSTFSEGNFNRLFPATVLFAIGVATAWSVFAANFLGLDFLKSVWDYAGELASSAMGFWSKIFAWGIFAVGLLGIAGWAAGRHQSLNQRHRLQRIKRCVKLYLRAVEPEAGWANNALQPTPQSGAADR